MILELYSIYDKKLGEFLPPFCCKNEADAVRMCSNLVNHSDSLMLKFPEDYCCHLVGTFDTESRDLVCELDNYDLKPVSFEFNTLVKDQTTKYKDILNKIESCSGVIDNKLLLLSDKINKLDSLHNDYKKYYDDLKKQFEELSSDEYIVEKRENLPLISNNSVDTPDFLPTNNTKSKKSFLDKLFS